MKEYADIVIPTLEQLMQTAPVLGTALIVVFLSVGFIFFVANRLLFPLLKANQSHRIGYIRYLKHFFTYVSDAEREVIKDHLSANAFRKCTGIDAERKEREKLIQFHTDASYRITWPVIRHGREFLELHDQAPPSIRELNRIEKFQRFYNKYAIYACIGLSLIIAIIGAFNFQQPWQVQLKYYANLPFFWVTILLLQYSNRPYAAHETLRVELESLQQNKANTQPPAL